MTDLAGAAAPFPEWLRALMGFADWSVKDLADELRVSRTTVTRWRTGTMTPGREQTARIEQALAACPTGFLAACIDAPHEAPLLADVLEAYLNADPHGRPADYITVSDAAGQVRTVALDTLVHGWARDDMRTKAELEAALASTLTPEDTDAAPA